MMAWVAFDRAVRSVEYFGKEGPVDRWRQIRDEIHGRSAAGRSARSSTVSPSRTTVSGSTPVC